jgi:transposase InsO family protein
VSRQTIHAERAKARAVTNGDPPSTAPGAPCQSPLPARKEPRGVPADALAAVIEGKVEEFPAWGARKVWTTLRRKGLRVSRRRVHARMHAAGLVLPRASGERREGAPRSHATPLPNRRIAADFITTTTVADGVGAVVLAVDCGCRSVLDVNVSKSQAAGPVLASVDRALEAAFGAPKNVPHGVELRTAHGPQYTGYYAEELAAAWGVTQTFAPVGRPTGNAVAERTIRAMKEKGIWPRDWPDAETLQRPPVQRQPRSPLRAGGCRRTPGRADSEVRASGVWTAGAPRRPGARSALVELAAEVDAAADVVDAGVEVRLATQHVEVVLGVVGAREDDAVQLVERRGLLTIDGEDEVAAGEADLLGHAARHQRPNNVAVLDVLDHHAEILALLEGLGSGWRGRDDRERRRGAGEREEDGKGAEDTAH